MKNKYSTWNKNFASTSQLIVMALIQAVKLLFLKITRLLFWFGVIALAKVYLH